MSNGRREIVVWSDLVPGEVGEGGETEDHHESEQIWAKKGPPALDLSLAFGHACAKRGDHLLHIACGFVDVISGKLCHVAQKPNGQ